jgi:hypothetical protein
LPTCLLVFLGIARAAASSTMLCQYALCGQTAGASTSQAIGSVDLLTLQQAASLCMQPFGKYAYLQKRLCDHRWQHVAAQLPAVECSIFDYFLGFCGRLLPSALP